MNVLIPNVSNKPILSSGATGAAKNIQINTGSSLTVLGMTLQIAGTINNNGTFTADNGTIEMKGVLAQIIPSGAFASNNLLNLIISNASGVTLSGALNITGYLKAATGDLASNGNLKLISSAAQTALIDGSGNGQVTGNVTMQRYLAIGYGYKYFSSPFTSLTVGAFAPYVNLAATFPTFYRYDENNSIGGLGIDFISGWVKWITSSYALNPMAGYAANFGNLVNPKTVEVTGVVSNGNISNPYLNHNRIYTTGFNLAGNPYPSPIDWNASGWTKTNIDNAIYFFDASIGSTDEWSGTYCSFVNGISSGGSTNIIPSMQGFFVHVTDGSFPVTGTLGMTNSVRKNDFTTPFKSAAFDSRTILRFTAGFDVKGSISDQFVIYFDPLSTPLFDKEKDALKMMNTDPLVPNIYALTKDTRKVSISGIPVPNDSITRIPVGIKTLKDGWVNLNAVDISLLPSTLNIYLVDSDTKILQDLRKISSYRAYLSTGDNDKRFYLIFSTKDLTQSILPTGKLFTLSRIANQLLVNVNLPFNSDGELIMTNMQGQIMLRKSVFGLETVEINSNVSTGVYVITVISGKNRESEKIIIRKDYE
ncbi:MAG: T9SS type A sorting domain-containing protein, partial [Prolixibacteraceae bacterium]